jgi:7,8-dihydropterin-6-yl-methyl-4-(beta-D-ribofuranosyl)aminobenzene 5'-phosphate synthase
MAISLTLLVENSARGLGVLGEHGLSWWLDTGTHRVLFDTGQGMALLNNARRLGVDLSQADAIVLSHGHADHVGGLEQALAAAPRAALFMHPRATDRRYSGTDRKPKGRRLSTDFMETEAFRAGGRRVVVTAEPVEVVPGVWTTGEVPRETDFEDTGGPLFLDEAMTQPDPLLDDLSLYVPTAQGTVVVCGCAHSGVINTLRHITRLTHDAPVRAIFGGVHLENASPRRMDETIRALRGYHPYRLGCCHCTGFRPLLRLNAEFPEACVQVAAGARHEFGD